MRRLISAALLAAALSLVSVASAFAQVHGVTPLNCPGPTDSVPNNPNAGGQGTQGTPADDTEGGPIAAPIPINTGNAPFSSSSGDAGEHSSHCR